MATIRDLEEEIRKLKERNLRVELDKAWERSWTRRLLIFILTYIVIVIFFIFVGLSNPFINSLVPALAFLLSTLTISIMKKVWLRFIYEK